MRSIAGLSNADAARVLSLGERPPQSTWTDARAWLYEEIKSQLRISGSRDLPG